MVFPTQTEPSDRLSASNTSGACTVYTVATGVRMKKKRVIGWTLRAAAELNKGGEMSEV